MPSKPFNGEWGDCDYGMTGGTDRRTIGAAGAIDSGDRATKTSRDGLALRRDQRRWKLELLLPG